MKTTRRITALFLALALIAAMAVPALAAQTAAKHTVNGTEYTYTITAKYTSTMASASMTFPISTVNLKCQVRGTVHCESEYFYNYDTSSGTGSVSASTDAQIIFYGVLTQGTMVGSRGDYYVNNEYSTYLVA